MATGGLRRSGAKGRAAGRERNERARQHAATGTARGIDLTDEECQAPLNQRSSSSG